MTNDVRSIAPWVLMFSAGPALVGKLNAAGTHLEPVFQLEPQVVKGPNGKPSIALSGAPLLFLESLRRIG
ncbi:MAG: hypothetical protein ACYDC2_03280, partial [Solirubrobacteraceae bacterium]